MLGGARWRMIWASLGLVLLGPFAAAQAPLADPVGYLAAHGEAATEEALVASWVERAWGRDERFVYGFRLDDGGALRDVYFDAATGASLDTAGILALGILPKPLGIPAAQVESETVLAVPAPANPPQAKRAKDVARLPELVLPPVDAARLLAEDAQHDAFERGRLRLGVAEDLPQPITLAELRAASASKQAVAAVVLSAPGARGLRLHVRLDAANAANTLRVYDPDRPDTVFTPAPEEVEWWSPTVWNERVVVECDSAFSGDLVIDRALQVYRQPGDALFDKAAGACETDVSCQDRWRAVALGVGGVGTVLEDDFVFCTGSLLADADGATNVPYLLTANHCVASSSEASPLEMYWLYQTTACGGAIPDISQVPRTTGGANFLAGNNNFTGTDLSFLRLRNNPPAGLTWLGWETVAPSLGADVVGIHHPNSDFKRISFGGLIDRGSDRLRPASRFHEVRWSTGVTEPGSSGSPLFLGSTQRIIGQLYGGNSACRSPFDPDYYGRFDVSYFLISRYLGDLPNPYDVNSDHAINAADMQQVIHAALSKPLSVREDLDGSGHVDATDIQIIIVAVLSFSK